MIEKNLGNVERVIRAAMGIGLLVWTVLFATSVPLVEIFVVLIAAMLILNGVFSRCFLWYVLDLNTCERCPEKVCDPRL